MNDNGSVPRDQLGDALRAKLDEYDVTDPEEAARLYSNVLDEFIPGAAETLKKGLQENADEVLGERVEREEGFRERLYETWKPALDRLHQIMAASEEMGEEILREIRARDEDRTYRSQALIGLHIRACRVAREIRCLLLGGFSNGALSRWRTLYELTVVMDLIAEHGEELAERYIHHSIYMARRQMRQYGWYQEDLGFEPVEESEEERLEASVSELEDRYGEAFTGSDYGWAAEALDNPSPHFGNLVDAVDGLEKLKPFRNMAHDAVHAGSKALTWSLSSPGKDNRALTAGASNYGLADPGQLTAHMMVVVTSILIAQYPTVDRLVVAQALSEIQEEAKQEFGQIQDEVEAKWKPS